MKKRIILMSSIIFMIIVLFGCQKKEIIIGAWEIEKPDNAIVNNQKAIIFIDINEDSSCKGYIDDIEIEGNYPIENHLLEPGIHTYYLDFDNQADWEGRFEVEAGKYYYLSLGNFKKNNYNYIKGIEK